jgi:hypothetical protein
VFSTDSELVFWKPSHVAASIIAVTRQVLRVEPVWPSELAQLCEYSFDDLESCVSQLQNTYDSCNLVLDEADTGCGTQDSAAHTRSQGQEQEAFRLFKVEADIAQSQGGVLNSGFKALVTRHADDSTDIEEEDWFALGCGSPMISDSTGSPECANVAEAVPPCVRAMDFSSLVPSDATSDTGPSRKAINFAPQAFERLLTPRQEAPL